MAPLNDDYKDDEIIEVKLPRSDYLLLRKIIQERQAKNWLSSKISGWWVFALGSGVLVLWNLWNHLQSALNGMVK